jgi:hypothetical protein
MARKIMASALKYRASGQHQQRKSINGIGLTQHRNRLAAKARQPAKRRNGRRRWHQWRRRHQTIK